MMKLQKCLLVLSAAMILSLSACGSSGVSQADYEAQSTELKNIKDKYETQSEELEETKKELLEFQTREAQEGLDIAGGKAWAQTSFGKDADCFLLNNELFVYVPKGYTISSASINKLWQDILSAAKLYADYYQQAENALPYDSFTVIVLDEQTKLDMMSVQVLKSEDGKFDQNVQMINLQEWEKLSMYLINASKQ